MSYRDSDFEIDLNVDNAHTHVIRLVGRKKKVLELGCATGYMSKVLTHQFECEVTGIEQNPEAAEKAKTVCSRVIVGDLENLDYVRELGNKEFDVIICADVLEHLQSPSLLLSAVRPLLSREGYLVASIPNIAHVSVIAELLEGRFSYRPEGLLDESHLRFFTLDSIYECFENAGLFITRLERIQLEPQETEFRTNLSHYPPELIKLLCAHQESTTYQFVLRARPAGGNNQAGAAKEAFTREERSVIRAESPKWSKRDATSDDISIRWRETLEALFGRMRFLEEERRRQARQLGELGERVLHRDAQIRHLQRESAARDNAIETYQEQIASQQGQIEQLQTRLSVLESSASWKLAKRLQKLIHFFLPDS